MARRSAPVTLTKLLDHTKRPIYLVDGDRRIVYCNAALAAWLDLDPARIVGRLVEYHSEPVESAPARENAAPLSELCPPPCALAGEACEGTISCVIRDGRLVHRQAEFVPLELESCDERAATLVLLKAHDMSPQEVTSGRRVEPSTDELHRTIRQFRRTQAANYAIESLLGNSPAMGRVRAQVAAAAASGANVLIVGRRGTGRRHIAHAIHYHTVGDSPTRLVPIDCEVLSDNLLRRALDTLQSERNDGQERATLLLQNLEVLSTSHQSQLSSAIRQTVVPARVMATSDSTETSLMLDKGQASGPQVTLPTIAPALIDALATITIHVPRLVDRLEDLPILAQCFLEARNRRSDKQVGSIHRDAMDLLGLHTWPGELSELREVISAAHRHCETCEIGPADLPEVIHHAKQAAVRVRRPMERIVLDELLADIEKEVLSRALTQTRGNKSEAAELLGMTRPRLYRRMVQLGLIANLPSEPDGAGPEFIERDPTDPSP